MTLRFQACCCLGYAPFGVTLLSQVSNLHIGCPFKRAQYTVATKECLLQSVNCKVPVTEALHSLLHAALRSCLQEAALKVTI